MIAARIDRLPPSRTLWKLVALLSLGGFFELFDLFQTAYISPGLYRQGIFANGANGWLGFSDQGAFTAATFAGLFVGASLLSGVADRFGRRNVFTYALVCYSLMSLVMACQSSAAGLIMCRLLVGIGLGIELVTIDAYLSELVPKSMRNKAFALAFSLQFLAVPCVALLSWLLVPHHPAGLAGWRWVIIISAAFALLVWRLRQRLPESPRWLAQHGHQQQANDILVQLEQQCAQDIKAPLEPPTAVPHSHQDRVSLATLWQPPYRRRMIMLIIFNLFQAIGFFGFGNWLPSLVSGHKAAASHGLLYAFFITLAYPLGSLVMMKLAARIENKWQIVASSLGTVVFGSLFALAQHPLMLVISGFAITLCNAWMTYAFHAYQTELFPTEIRARAVGFCYSFSRLSTVFSSVLIGILLGSFGVTSVLAFIIGSMLIVILTIGLLGPRTRGIALESINAH